MKKTRLVLILFALFQISVKNFAQVTTLVCNDLVFVPLEENCSTTISAGSILEGGPYFPFDHYLVDLDKTPPYGNGPWVQATVALADIGKTYMVRVTDPDTGNKCWGNVKIGTQLECGGISTISLGANGTVDLNPSMFQVTVSDACTPTNTMTISQLGTAAFDCSDLGVQTVVLTATDQSNNTSICSVLVNVTDPLSACNSCISGPPAATVSFEQATQVLLPALKSGNLSAFDSFGGAAYNPGCNMTDSTYAVEYHPSAQNDSWFIRHWIGKNGSGQVVGEYQQPIFFPFHQNFTVSGTVFVDSIENCQLDPGESGFSVLQVVATKLPSGKQFAVLPNPDGVYSLDLVTHGLDSAVLVQIKLPDGLASPCPTTLSIPGATTAPVYDQDFGIRTNALCPVPEISLQANRLRRCVPTIYYVQYCNKGLAPLANAYALITIDTLLEVTEASLPWSSVNGNIYRFPLGDLPPLSCQTFTITANVRCEAVLGQTLCVQAYIYPHTRCDTAAWGGPHIEARAACSGDTVDLSIWNTGAQGMTAPLDFIVIEDVIMYRQGKFQLNAGDSMSMKMPANGATWRLEAVQIPGDPEGDHPTATLEGCGGLNIPGLVNAFPLNEAPAFSDIECKEVVGSFDPNEKSATPTGYSADHIIRANTGIEYTIQFQNTGTDTAFRVVVIDTLSPQLDFASLQAGVASHPYRLDVYEGGILQFVFDPILLPDSNVNEAASHGFVTFRIGQKAGLPAGTGINNHAAIYFDFNDPVITNTVRHTIGAPFVALNASHVEQPGLKVVLMPHPMHDYAILTVEGHMFRQGLLTLYDLYGRPVQTRYFTGEQCRIDRQNLLNGVYFFQVSEEGALVASGKLQVY